jgi:hypothetical protein
MQLLAGVNMYAPRNRNPLQEVDMEKVALDAISAIPDPVEELPAAVKSAISEPCKMFLRSILKLEPAERLGTTSEGVKAIRNHPFFGCYDFDKMLSLEIPPPYKPVQVHGEAKEPMWSSFENMMTKLEASDIGTLLGSAQDNSVKERHQRYFKNWDYVSQATFRLEFGLQQKKTQRHMVLQQGSKSPTSEVAVETPPAEAAGEAASATAVAAEEKTPEPKEVVVNDQPAAEEKTPEPKEVVVDNQPAAEAATAPPVEQSGEEKGEEGNEKGEEGKVDAGDKAVAEEQAPAQEQADSEEVPASGEGQADAEGEASVEGKTADGEPEAATDGDVAKEQEQPAAQGKEEGGEPPASAAVAASSDDVAACEESKGE